jgi:hypothetical protein
MAISTKLVGGLGNIMFITAAMEYAAKRFGYKSTYPNLREHIELLKSNFYNYNLKPDDLVKLFKNFNWHIGEEADDRVDRIIKVPYGYNNITDLTDNTMLLGYFQSEEYWGGERDFAMELFSPSEFVLDQLTRYAPILEGKPCAIHIRRGDYLKFPDIFPPIDIDYIKRARANTDGKGTSHYLVFSDDMRWCRDNLKGSEYVFVEPEADYLVLFLIGKCHNKIIANSSLSWWGAYLSDKGGEVFAPQRWFNKPDIDDNHICPWYWKRI